MSRRFSKVAKDKKTGLPKKYLEGAKNRSAKAKEIKKTAAAYKSGKKINVKAISASRAAQGKKNVKGKTSKRNG